MFWRFCRTKPFIDSYSTSRDRQSNASPLFFGSPLIFRICYWILQSECLHVMQQSIPIEFCKYTNRTDLEPSLNWSRLAEFIEI